MSNFGLPEYDQHREWIRNARNRNMKWEQIDYAGQGNDEGLSVFLSQQTMLNFWKEARWITGIMRLLIWEHYFWQRI